MPYLLIILPPNPWHYLLTPSVASLARGYFCVTSGELTEEMTKEYLDHYFEPKVDDNFRTEDQTGLLTRTRTFST